ncbi:glycoside hydrolase family 16 protein [Fibrobacter sp.]
MKFFIFTIFSAFCCLFADDFLPVLDITEHSAKLQWRLVWHDEFDNALTIDSNWIAENRAPKHIISSRWRENISVDDGLAFLWNRKEKRGNKEWTSGSMTSKQSFKYGFFESRMKISAASGVNNSFWMFQWNKTKSTNAFEMDIVEAQYPNKIKTNIHNMGFVDRPMHRQDRMVYHASDDLFSRFHTYAVEWDETKISFFFDGKLIREKKNDECNQEAYLVVGAAVMKWAGEITDSIDGTSMIIDYVRVWEKVK